MRYVHYVPSRTWPYLILRQAVQRGALRCAEVTGMKTDRVPQDLLRDQIPDRMSVPPFFVNRTAGCLQRPVAFIDEQEKALRYIRESTAISIEEKKRFYRSINTNLGATALCLSGGASFGYCEIIADSIVLAINSQFV